MSIILCPSHASRRGQLTGVVGNINSELRSIEAPASEIMRVKELWTRYERKAAAARWVHLVEYNTQLQHHAFIAHAQLLDLLPHMSTPC